MFWVMDAFDEHCLFYFYFFFQRISFTSWRVSLLEDVLHFSNNRDFNGLQWMEFSWGHCSNRWPPLFHNVNQDEIYANETSGLYFISNSAEKIGLLAGITFDIFTITVYLRCNTLISNETNRNVNGVRKLHVGWLWCDIPIKQLELANFSSRQMVNWDLGLLDVQPTIEFTWSL